jgi:hypothetical protein
VPSTPATSSSEYDFSNPTIGDIGKQKEVQDDVGNNNLLLRGAQKCRGADKVVDDTSTFILPNNEDAYSPVTSEKMEADKKEIVAVKSRSIHHIINEDVKRERRGNGMFAIGKNK